MTIILDKYVLEQSQDRFDLYKKLENPKQDKNGKEIIKGSLIGYDMSMEYCLKKMPLLNLSEKDKVVTLNEFINLYKKEVVKITKQFEA